MLEDKGDEDVIGVLALRCGAGLFENFPGVIAQGVGLRIELLDLDGPGRILGWILEDVAFSGKDVIELLLETLQLRTVAAINRPLISGLIEKHGRLLELI